MAARRSRLTLKTEKKTRKTIVLTSLGILIILILLLKFGINMLVGFSVFLAGTRNQSTTNANSSNEFIASPVLDPLPNATNSAKIEISGKSQSNNTVELYINNNLKDTVQADVKGTFLFIQTLFNGENQIKTRVKKNNQLSDFSNSFSVFLKNIPPSLTVDSPSDGQSFSKDQSSIIIKGKTDSGVTITVNGFWAIIDENNNFSYNLPLQNGDNQIKITATDQAGNNTEKNLKVNYSQ